ncbi:TRAP transporter large permease [Desulfotignum balticum]|uniref:TRAP transporter large permease n=1 Tax=Desulfotignum balticum TaxID=115781 RepID=UPI000404A1B3|nr:TRAP transporter large permease subunit [Desulfotignum balticum]
MAPEYLAFIMLGLIITSIIIGIPVAFCLASIPLIFGYFVLGTRTFPMLAMQGWGTNVTYPFVAAPLFIFMGSLMERSGIAEQLFESFYHLLGRVSGGLALATVAMATIFGACTGNVGAGVITIGLLALPPMLNRGYDKALATGSIMVGGGLGVTIPPSIMLILYGAATGVSISKLFMAAIIPGVLLGIMYIAYIYGRARLNPEMAPSVSIENRIQGMALFKMTLKSLVPPIFLILAVLGSIFFGIVSPSEAGSMGVIGSLILIAISKKLNLQVFTQSVTYTLKITSAIVLICLGGKIFTGIFIAMGGDVGLRNFMEMFNLGTTGMMLMMLFIVFILGMVMDWIALIFILTPIFGPIISAIGMDPLYFGILFCTTLEISNMTPPFAYSVFYLKTITPPEVTIGDMYRGCVPFAIVDVLCTALLILFPGLVMWLPSIMK